MGFKEINRCGTAYSRSCRFQQLQKLSANRKKGQGDITSLAVLAYGSDIKASHTMLFLFVTVGFSVPGT